MHFSHPVQAASSTVRTFSSRWMASGGHSGKHRPQRSHTARSTTAIVSGVTRRMGDSLAERAEAVKLHPCLGLRISLPCARSLEPAKLFYRRSRAATLAEFQNGVLEPGERNRR